MRNNLIAEMVRKGYSADQVPKILAKVLGCTDRTIRNKLNNVTDFTFSEVMKIDEKFFKDEFDLKYLFKTAKSKEPAA